MSYFFLLFIKASVNHMQPKTLNYMVRSYISFILTGYKLGMRIIAGNIFWSRSAVFTKTEVKTSCFFKLTVNTWKTSKRFPHMQKNKFRKVWRLKCAYSSGDLASLNLTIKGIVAIDYMFS